MSSDLHKPLIINHHIKDTAFFRILEGLFGDWRVSSVNRNNEIKHMKTTLTLLLALGVLASPMLAQDAPATSAATRPRGGSAQSEEKKFSLDFPGGTAKDLIAAIQESSGEPVNVIISSENKDVRIAPIKVKGVTVRELLSAVTMAGSRNQTVDANGHAVQTSYAFLQESRDGIWVFSSNRAPEKPNYCRFYQLAELLGENYKVEDITTAIQTGWKLLKVATPPELKFHAETKLLIAVGHQEDLVLIDSVLTELHKAVSKSAKSQPAAENKEHAAAK